MNGSWDELALCELCEIFFKDVTGFLPGSIAVEDARDKTLFGLGALDLFLAVTLAFPLSRRGIRGIEFRWNPPMDELGSTCNRVC